MTLKSTGENICTFWALDEMPTYPPHHDDMEEYPEFIDFEWSEFLDAIRDGSLIPDEDGKAVVRWFPK